MADPGTTETAGAAGGQEIRAPGPAALGPDDRVPLFRRDLVVRPGEGAGLFDVEDPLSGRRFTLYEFELTIGRMLDGRRTAADVVSNGVRLGIPVEVAGLNQFVRQMWHYGFLADAEAGPGAALPAAGGTWPDRRIWDDATRALFRSGVRLMRLGRGAEARSYFEAMLDSDPENPEATEMIALLDAGATLAAAPLGRARPAEVRARRRRRALFLAAVGVAAGVAGALAASALRPAPAPAAQAAPAALIAAPGPATPAPAAAQVGRALQRVHPRVADVVAPHAGRVVWRAADGARVARGERLGELHVEVPAAPDPALERRIAELERLAGQDAVYQDFLDKARRDRERSSQGREVRVVALTAPAAGRLARAPDASRPAAAAEAVARIVDGSRWWLGFSLDAAPPDGAVCEVLGDLPGERAPCRIVTRTAAPDRFDLVAEVAARDAPWLAGAAAPAVRLSRPPRSGDDRRQRLAEAGR